MLAIATIRKLVQRRLRELTDRLSGVPDAVHEIGYDEGTTQRMADEIARRVEQLRTS